MLSDSRVDHLSAYLDLFLDTDLEKGLMEWQRAFGEMREAWQLGSARNLLQLLKRRALSNRQRAKVYNFEGHLLAQQSAWQEALKAYERSIAFWHDQVAARAGIGNMLRHLEGRAAEAANWYQEALTFADSESRADVLNNLGLAYYESGQLEQARATLNEVLEMYRQRRDRIREASALHNLGSVAWTQGRLIEAEGYFSSAFAIYQELGQRHDTAETLNSLGLAQEAQGLWDQAAAAYREALSLLESFGDEIGQAQTLANLGNALILTGDYQRAHECFDRGLVVARGLGDARLEGQLLSGLGDLLLMQGKGDQAIAMLLRAIDRKKASGDERSLKHTWLSLGAAYHKVRQLDKADESYHRALDAARAQGDRRIESHTLINLAKTSLTQSRLEQAASWLDEAEPIAKENSLSDALSDIAQLRGDLELLRPAPDYHVILRCYMEALLHAHDFNASYLQQTLDYLSRLIHASADDGQKQLAVKMALDLAQLSEDASLQSQVVNVFRQVADEISGSNNA